MLDPNELITITRGELDAMQERAFAKGMETGKLIGSQNGRDEAEHAAHVQNMRRYNLIIELRCGCQTSGETPLVYCDAHLPELENEAAVIRNLTNLAMSY